MEWDKDEGKRVTKDSILDHFKRFFHNGDRLRTDVARKLLGKVQALLALVEKMPKYRMYSTSLLLIYEGWPQQNEEKNEEEEEEVNREDGIKADIKLIDFAHTFDLSPDTSSDDGYVWALQNLIRLLEQVQDSHNL